MEGCDPAYRRSLEGYLNSAWESINNGTVDDGRRKKYWQDWTGFTQVQWRVSPFLESCGYDKRAAILSAFAVRVRQGDYGRGHRITTQSVDRALRAVGQTFQLAGRNDPTKIHGGRERIIQLRRQLETYRREDPPPKPQLALPVSVIKHLQVQSQAGGLDPDLCAVNDLATIAFFFLLRVGEYTMPAANRKTRTVQFRVKDVRFYVNGIIIPNTAPLQTLMQANGVALCIDNQKNGTRGETVHQHALPHSAICPVQALARRVASIMSASSHQDVPISTLASGHATALMIRTQVRQAVRDLKLYRQGIKVANVGSHSLRAGGAMAMKLNGCDLITIMKTGRWTSLTFLTYIHNQIAHLGANITHRMAQPVPFFSF